MPRNVRTTHTQTSKHEFAGPIRSLTLYTRTHAVGSALEWSDFRRCSAARYVLAFWARWPIKAERKKASSS